MKISIVSSLYSISKFITKSHLLFPCQHSQGAFQDSGGAGRQEQTNGNVGNGNKDKPKGHAGALCTAHRVPLDVAGDTLCEGQKQTAQQKQADVDKRRHTGLIIREPGEFPSKMPPQYLVALCDPIRPKDVPL